MFMEKIEYKYYTTHKITSNLLPDDLRQPALPSYFQQISRYPDQLNTILIKKLLYYTCNNFLIKIDMKICKDRKSNPTKRQNSSVIHLHIY